MSDRNRIREKRRAYKLASFDIRKHTPRQKSPEELDRIAAAKARQEKEQAIARQRQLLGAETSVRVSRVAGFLGLGLLGVMQSGASRRRSRFGR